MNHLPKELLEIIKEYEVYNQFCYYRILRDLSGTILKIEYLGVGILQEQRLWTIRNFYPDLIFIYSVLNSIELYITEKKYTLQEFVDILPLILSLYPS